MSQFRKHLKNRGLSEDIYCWICDSTELVYFPIFNLHKELVGYQKYDWNAPKIRCNHGRYYTYITKKYRPNKRTPVINFWGMQYLLGGIEAEKENTVINRGKNVLFVTEGVWDAIRIVEAGFNSVAILCNDPNKQLTQYFRLVTSHKDTVGILDSGEAGLKLRKCVKDYMVVPDEYGDINSMPPDKAKEFLEQVVSRM